MDTKNDVFLVSSVNQRVINGVAESLAPWAKGARVLVLAYPCHAYAVDTKGACLPANASASFDAKSDRLTAYRPLSWTPSCQNAILMRNAHSKEHRENYVRQRTLEDQIARLKESLQGELILNEQLGEKLGNMENMTKHASKASERLRKHKQDVAATSCVLLSELHHLESEIVTVKGQVEELSSELALVDLELQTVRSEKGSNDAKLAALEYDVGLLVQVAMQCFHYFMYDRFTSPYMQQHICIKNGVEHFPLCILAGFPRLVALCDGDVDVIRFACGCLGFDVSEDTVALGSYRASHATVRSDAITVGCVA